MRIYSNYTPEQFSAIQNAAAERGMSMSAYQRYVTLMSLPQGNTSTHNIPQLIQQMFSNLTARDPGTFIVSALVDPDIWVSLSRSEKKVLAMQLAAHVKKHPNQFIKAKDPLPGKITQYRKL